MSSSQKKVILEKIPPQGKRQQTIVISAIFAEPNKEREDIIGRQIINTLFNLKNS